MKSGRVEARGRTALLSALTDGSPRVSSGGLEKVGAARGCTRRCPNGQAEVIKDFADHYLLEDRRDNRQGTAAVGTMLQIDIGPIPGL